MASIHVVIFLGILLVSSVIADPRQKNIVIYRRSYQGTYGDVYRMSTGQYPGGGYERVDGTNARSTDDVSYIRGYFESFDEIRTGFWPDDQVIGGGFEVRLRVCAVQQFYTDGMAMSFHVLTRNLCQDLLDYTPSAMETTVEEVDHIYVSHVHRSNPPTKRFRAAICQGFNHLIYGIVTSSIAYCPSTHLKVHEFDFYAFGGDLFCPLLEPSEGLNVFYMRADNIRETNALLTCSSPYKFAGNSSSQVEEIECSPQGLWVGNVPSCERINCGNPPSIAHGQFVGPSYEFDEVVDLVCDEGYTTDVWTGSSLRCLESGVWSEVSGNCTPVNCGSPPSVSNGLFNGSSHYYPHAARLVCDEGHQASARYQLIRCQANGLWSPPHSSCEAINCGFPSVPENGRLIGGEYTYLKEVAFRCDHGFRLVGPHYITCQGNGEWTNSTTTCEAIRCNELSPPTDGYIIGDSVEVGATVEFNCSDGFALEGASTLRCDQHGDQGVWSREVPTCSVLVCAAFPAPNHGVIVGERSRFGSSLTYTCQNGYMLRVTSACANDGPADLSLSCEAVECPYPRAPDNGSRIGEDFTYGALVEFNCTEGYRLIGASNVSCEQTGEWSDDVPICESLSCPDPGSPHHGFRHGNDFSVGSTVRFSCMSLEPRGSDRATCLPGGTWSSPTPICHTPM